MLHPTSRSDILAVATATQAASSTHAPASSQAAAALREWTALATLSHTEERLSLAAMLGASSSQTQTDQHFEVDYWLNQWVTFCTASGLHHKVRWAANRLLQGAVAERSRAKANASGRLTSSSSGSNAGPVSGSVSVSANQSALLPAGSWDFFDTTREPLRLLRGVLIPAVGRCGAAGGALLAEIEDAMELTLDEE